MSSRQQFIIALFCCYLIHLIIGCKPEESSPKWQVRQGVHISLVGNNLCSRMMEYDYFESYLHIAYPDSMLTVRNLCDGGDTPAFRPHSARNTPWPFEGADSLFTELANASESEGHFPYPDEWLANLKTDQLISFFGYNESFNGIEDIPRYKKELAAFIKHTLSQQYNGKNAPQMALVSPAAFEDLSNKFDLPNGQDENKNLEAYTKAMQEVATQFHIRFLDLFHTSQSWYDKYDDLTIDGFSFNDKGYQLIGAWLIKELYGIEQLPDSKKLAPVKTLVDDKNWYWHNDYKIPNGVHVYGRRYEPFGPENYPAEIQKIRQLTTIRDTAIWAVAKGQSYDITSADSKTIILKTPETNFKPTDQSLLKYLYGDEALSKFTVADGFKVELFASEQEFPDLAKPVQMSFDDKGRLWVAVMPSYPHYKPGDARPNDKLIIFEDTNNDGKADKQITFADHLHLPIGFELSPEGVYISQGTNLKLYTDTNGDDKADKVETLLSGFDDHDTHHAISAFCADPSGAIYMAEGVFLHTNVETPYGPIRATNGGFMRYNANRKHLQRAAQLSIPNPWGIAFDDWGQNIFAETSGPDVRWMMPGSIRPVYGKAAPASPSLFEESHRVRPTSGLEFVSSRHFPDEMQGDLLINNTIGFLGMKQHTLVEDGTGFSSCHRQDVITSKDGNFRPVDMEFAPDGSLYLIDWHNILIGHMQHNARDPLRDHSHGRVYRITYPSRPLVVPAKIDGASIAQLLDNLKLPEYRSRYRSRRALRGHDKNEVLQAVNKWVNALDKNDSQYEHHLLEALWVTWGVNSVDKKILQHLLRAKDYRARAAAVRVVNYNHHQLPLANEWLRKAASDPHGRVRLEAIVAASWLDKSIAKSILDEAKKHPLDSWMLDSYNAVVQNFESRIKEKKKEEIVILPNNFSAKEAAIYTKGQQLYSKEGNCITCHQSDGRGVEASSFPPLANSKWVTQDINRLVKLTLHGLMGPMEVNGKKYAGRTPMIPYGGLLKDDEVAAVLSYVRNSFGNKASFVTKEDVSRIRKATADHKGFYQAQELLRQHPTY